MIHFVIVYDRAREAIVERQEFPDAQRAAAWAAHDRMVRKYLAEPHLEVVLLGSESEDALRATHGRYFVPLGPASL